MREANPSLNMLNFLIMETIVSEYEKQALDFLEKTKTTFKAEYLKHDYHFAGDKDKRDIYKITLSRGRRSYTFNFGQSINNSGFYYTKGKNITHLDRSLLTLTKDQIVSQIKRKDWSFMNNGKSDIIHYPKQPTPYDILACLTKYDPGTFENFCSEFGYDEDSRTAEKTYNSVCDEYKNVCALFTDEEIELLTEIQ